MCSKIIYLRKGRIEKSRIEKRRIQKTKTFVPVDASGSALVLFRVHIRKSPSTFDVVEIGIGVWNHQSVLATESSSKKGNHGGDGTLIDLPGIDDALWARDKGYPRLKLNVSVKSVQCFCPTAAEIPRQGGKACGCDRAQSVFR